MELGHEGIQSGSGTMVSNLVRFSMRETKSCVIMKEHGSAQKTSNKYRRIHICWMVLDVIIEQRLTVAHCLIAIERGH